MRRILDNISTACWFGMDTCWMHQHTVASIIFMILALLLLLVPGPTHKKDTDIIVWLATVSWLIVNSCWMTNDILGKDKLDFLEYIKNMFTVTGVITILFIFIYDTHRIIKIRRFK